MGRNCITLEDVPITVKVVLSTASIERVSLLDLLLARGGSVTLSKAAKALSTSKSTILKRMTELEALEVVDLEDEVIVEFNPTQQITLKPNFDWLLTEDFTKMRDGFIPIDNSKYIDDEERRPSFDKESIFWQRFTELEKQSIDGLVQYQKLKDSLVSSTVFIVGDAVLMMQTMVVKGRLEMVEQGYYRRAKPIRNKPVDQTTTTHNGHNHNTEAKILLLNCLYGNGEGVTVLPPTCSLLYYITSDIEEHMPEKKK